MGMICRSSLLVSFMSLILPALFINHLHIQNVVPALVETIKELGLVLVADTSDEPGQQPDRGNALPTSTMGVADWAYRMPDGVNGVMKANGVLRFNDMIDM